MEYVIGIDVGTDSVRGALVDKTGKICKVAVEEITTWNSKPDFYQQSSNEIWLTCCKVIKLLTEGVTSGNVRGLGFDATCSLAVCDTDGNPVSVDPDEDDCQNVILWMDHRAKTETKIINEIHRTVLGYQDRNVSIEKSIPKLLWLKRNHPHCWQKAAHYFLLPDFLTWRATGRSARSLCSVVCGFNYDFSPDGNNCGWMKPYYDAIGLHDLAENNWDKIGSEIIPPGKFCGSLNAKTAQETGLPVGTPVAAAVIDALSGALGLLGCRYDSLPINLTSRVVLVGGTSTCHMYQTEERIFVPGVWGPYCDVLLPNLWLLVGGQSVSGKLIDHVIDTHPATQRIREKHPHLRITEYLNDILHKISKNADGSRIVDELTDSIHVYPDFHGNRSPLADENLRGMVLGLTLGNDENNLALLYLATIQALVYSTKHIIEEIQRHSTTNTKIESLLICGGLSKNTIFVQSHANALGLQILLPKETESILLGSAMLAASASRIYPDLKTAAMGMAGQARQVDPVHKMKKFHDKKYEVYLELLRCQNKCRKLMKLD